MCFMIFESGTKLANLVTNLAKMVKIAHTSTCTEIFYRSCLVTLRSATVGRMEGYDYRNYFLLGQWRNVMQIDDWVVQCWTEH